MSAGGVVAVTAGPLEGEEVLHLPTFLLPRAEAPATEEPPGGLRELDRLLGELGDEPHGVAGAAVGVVGLTPASWST